MRLSVLALSLALGATPALAQSGNQPAGPVTTEKFVQTVAMSDIFEIASSRLAETKGTPSEKSFAEQMIHDHTQTSAELKGLVASEKLDVKLPTALDKEHKSALKSLRMAKGATFAGDYNTAQVKAHEDAISLFESYASSGDNAGLKDWATKTLPTLKHHLQMAQGLNS
jgi:putative membrane protein